MPSPRMGVGLVDDHHVAGSPPTGDSGGCSGDPRGPTPHPFRNDSRLQIAWATGPWGP